MKSKPDWINIEGKTQVNQALSTCELCERQVSPLTQHHLIPRQNTRRKEQAPSATIAICAPCHRQIHTLFDNHYLAQELNSLEKLKHHPELHRFLNWIRKQDPNKRVKVDRKRA